MYTFNLFFLQMATQQRNGNCLIRY